MPEEKGLPRAAHDTAHWEPWPMQGDGPVSPSPRGQLAGTPLW